MVSYKDSFWFQNLNYINEDNMKPKVQNRPIDIENKHGYQRGKKRGVNQEFGINIRTLIYINQIINNVIIHSTGNYTQYFVIIYNGKEPEKEYIDKYITESLCCSPKTDITL